MVHAPVVLLPLAAVGVLLLLVRRSWYDRYKWAVVVIAGIGALGGILAAASGESLESALSAEDRQLIESHTEMGDTARLMGIVFFVVVLAWVLIPIFLERRAASSAASSPAADVGSEVATRSSGAPTWLRPALSVLVVITAVGAVWTVTDAGHSGAKRVWEEDSTGGG
jgi:hypothetical protein